MGAMKTGKGARRVAVRTGEDLMRVLEDVRQDRQPRIVEREGKRAAAVIDIDDLGKVLAAQPTAVEIESAFAAAGSWRDVDAGAVKRAIYERRRRGSRPANRPA